MTCHNCKIEAKKSGKDRKGKGNQRYRCNQCRKTFQEMKENLLGTMRVSLDRAEMCLRLLLEGNSIRSIQRIGLHQETILNLLVLAGEKCERLLNEHMSGVAVKDVEADEIWGFVQCINRYKLHKEISDPTIGGAYTLLASNGTQN